jgi:hypothetical protein
MYDGAKPVTPIRVFKVARNINISTHPARPAEAVSPAAPQDGATPSHRGSGNANRYPRTVVSTTRTIAYRKGVDVSRKA